MFYRGAYKNTEPSLQAPRYGYLSSFDIFVSLRWFVACVSIESYIYAQYCCDGLLAFVNTITSRLLFFLFFHIVTTTATRKLTEKLCLHFPFKKYNTRVSPIQNVYTIMSDVTRSIAVVSIEWAFWISWQLHADPRSSWLVQGSDAWLQRGQGHKHDDVMAKRTRILRCCSPLPPWSHVGINAKNNNSNLFIHWPSASIFWIFVVFFSVISSLSRHMTSNATTNSPSTSQPRLEFPKFSSLRTWFYWLYLTSWAWWRTSTRCVRSSPDRRLNCSRWEQVRERVPTSSANSIVTQAAGAFRTQQFLITWTPWAFRTLF